MAKRQPDNTGKKYIKDEKRLQEFADLWPKMSVKEICEHFNMPRRTAYGIAKKLGLTDRKAKEKVRHRVQNRLAKEVIRQASERMKKEQDALTVVQELQATIIGLAEYAKRKIIAGTTAKEEREWMDRILKSADTLVKIEQERLEIFREFQMNAVNEAFMEAIVEVLNTMGWQLREQFDALWKEKLVQRGLSRSHRLLISARQSREGATGA